MIRTSLISALILVCLCSSIQGNPTRREQLTDEVACENHQCVEQEAFCFCGFTPTPSDRCGCSFACNQCPPIDWKPPVYWNLDLTGLVLPPIDFSGMFIGWGKK